jgi:hypothetical protein
MVKFMSKKWIWTGRVITAITGVFVLTSGLNLLFIRSADVREGFAKFGFSENAMTAIGAAAFLASLLYLIPRTAVLGAILMTGYMGGAIATHVRVNDPTFVAPLVIGILVWLGLFLREERLGSLLPLRH